jgi:hypothetical protein
MTDDEIQREIGASMLEFLLDDWGVVERELYDRLDLPGRGLIVSLDEELDDLVCEALEGAARRIPSDFQAMDMLREVAPGLHREIDTLLASLADVPVQTDFGVVDLHADNIGRADVGRLVVRDFGMNTLSSEMIARAVRHIRELPEPTAVLAA